MFVFPRCRFTKYRSSTKAKLARRKQQVHEEEQFQQHQHKFNAAAAFGGMGGMDLASSGAFGTSFMPFGMGAAAANHKQLSQMLSFQGADLNNHSGMDLFLKQQQQQQQLGLFSAPDSFMAQQHQSHRRDLLRHAPSMMGLPGGNQSSYMEPSMALGEAFDLLQNLQPARNQTSQLLGGLQQQQKRDTYFKDLLGAAFQNQHQPAPQQPAVVAATTAPIPQATTSQSSQVTARSKSGKSHKGSRRKRRKGGDNDDLESLPDDISGIFD
jgi:hypothetical protein